MKLKMEEKSQIRVVAYLSMTNCYLSGCGDMWKGIETVGQTYLHSYYSFIEDANIGMKLSGLAGMVCFGTDFINNYIGIATADPCAEDTEDKLIQRGQIWGCEFYTATTLPDPYPGHCYYPSWPTTPSETPYNQGFAAIYLSRTVGLNIGYDGADSLDRNKIHDMRNGIILRDETVSDISGTDFYNFEGGMRRALPDPLLDLNQFAIHMINVESNIRNDTMYNLMFGVYGLESSNIIERNEITLSTPSPGYGFTRGITLVRPQSAIIQENAINEGMRGISIEDVANDFTIEDNDLITSFYFLGINIRIFVRNAKLDPSEGVILNNVLSIDDALASTGIHLIDANLITVEDNDVIFMNDEEHQTRGILGVGTTRSTILGNTVYRHIVDVQEGNNGIELENSGFNTLFCNTMENFWINMHMFGPNLLSGIETNIINEAEFGFAITSPTMLGIQEDLGNKWLALYGDYGSYLFGSNPEVEALFSKFIVDELEDSDFMPHPIGPSSVSNDIWFVDEYTPLSPTFTCFDGPIPLVNADTLSKLIRTELTFEDFNDEMTWIMKSDIFDMILVDPGLTSNTVLDSFYSAEENTALGKLVAWQKDLSSRFGEERILKGLTLDTISSLSEDIVFIDSILALSPNDSATWIALRVLKADTLENEVAELKGYLDDEHTDSRSAYLAIAYDLDNLTTTNDLEAYLKEALLFKTQFLLGTAFSSGDSTDLTVLAGLCPWEGGRAQAVGQELYSTIDNLMILPSMDNCPSPRPFIAMPDHQSTYEGDVFLVTPNPVLETAEIKCDEVITGITVFNTEMKPVYTIQPMERQWSINMSKLAAGVYIISVSTMKNQFSQRIVRM
ncbi:MAG TPA: NosD domain-containing protein [Saprospiraceae bacterium]|nr:NosD domain-containing protein [Saprospiraceae bacterium]